MDKDKLLQNGFTEGDLTKFSDEFITFLLTYYNEMEIQALSVPAIIKGGNILYEVYRQK